jgi:hypothetical protein
MDVQGHVVRAFQAIRDEPLILILGGLLVGFLSGITLCLLAGPLFGPYVLMLIRYLRDGTRPQFNDLFSGLERFGALFPFFFLILLVMAGFLFFFIPGMIFLTWWIYALPLMVDQGMPLGEAMRASREKVAEKGFFLHLVFVLLISVVPELIINSVRPILPIVDMVRFLVAPLQWACLADLYIEQFDRIPPSSTDGPVPPPPPPQRTPPPLPGTGRTSVSL